MGWGFEKEKLDEAKIAKSKEMGRLAYLLYHFPA